MANTLTIQQLQDAKKMVDDGNVAEFYGYMEKEGYGYAALAKGVVECSFPNGSTALGFMVNAAQKQGINLTSRDITNIETDMAKGYINTLISAAATADNQISRDVTFREAYDFHDEAFKKHGLDVSAWTLEAPSTVLGPNKMEGHWQDIINPDNYLTTWQSTQLAADMAKSAFLGDKKAREWGEVTGVATALGPASPTCPIDQARKQLLENLREALPSAPKLEMPRIPSAEELLKKFTPDPTKFWIGAENDPKSNPLFQQTETAMNRLFEEKNYPMDQGRENMTAAMAVLVKEKGLNSVDGAVVNKENQVTAFEKTLGDWGMNYAVGDAVKMANTPAEQSLNQFALLESQQQTKGVEHSQALEQTQTMEQQALVQNQTQEQQRRVLSV